MSTMMTYWCLGRVRSLSALLPGIVPKIREKRNFRANIMENSGILVHFSQSRNPGIKASPIPGFGIEKMGRDPGIRDWNP